MSIPVRFVIIGSGGSSSLPNLRPLRDVSTGHDVSHDDLKNVAMFKNDVFVHKDHHVDAVDVVADSVGPTQGSHHWTPEVQMETVRPEAPLSTRQSKS